MTRSQAQKGHEPPGGPRIHGPRNELPGAAVDRETGDTWKLLSVQDFVGERPAAWIDSVLYVDAHKWAEHRDVPTLFIRTSSSVWLAKEHVDQLQTFSENFPSVHRDR